MAGCNISSCGPLIWLAWAGILPGHCFATFCRMAAQNRRHCAFDATTRFSRGAVTPDVGVHHFDLDAGVLLTAVPKPGYYFVYWIGDVSDPTAISTIIYMDAPKIVVAVFARSEFAFSLEETMMLGGGGGGTYPSAADYSNQGYTGGGSKRPPSPPPPPPSDEFPVPPPPDELPVPAHLPEPATALLLGLGSLLFVRRGTKR